MGVITGGAVKGKVVEIFLIYAQKHMQGTDYNSTHS